MSTPRLLDRHPAATAFMSLRTPLIAVAVAGLVAACGGSTVNSPPTSSTGSGSGSGSTGSGGTTTTTTGSSGAVTGAAKTTGDLGSVIAAQTIPGLSPQVTQGL